jgi:environmental stress-induced protein Ves
MQIHVTKKTQLQTNTWQGGTTKQLCIYPEGAVYKNLDFIFRISTATIDVEQSAFTVLPSVARDLMLLTGEMVITHKGHHTKQLKKFDTDSFKGDWETTSMGKATDFNIMTRGNAKAHVKGFTLPEKANKELVLASDVIAIYVYRGEVRVEQPTIKTILQEGDVALIYKQSINEAFSLHGLRTAEVAIAQIYL